MRTFSQDVPSIPQIHPLCWGRKLFHAKARRREEKKKMAAPCVTLGPGSVGRRTLFIILVSATFASIGIFTVFKLAEFGITASCQEGTFIPKNCRTDRLHGFLKTASIPRRGGKQDSCRDALLCMHRCRYICGHSGLAERTLYTKIKITKD